MNSSFAALALLALATGGCRQAPSPMAAYAPVSEAEAGKIADATATAWTSMDAAKIKALYAPSIVGFDFSSSALATDRTTWDKAQDFYAATKIDGAKQIARKVQLIGADAFVVSGMWDLTSSTIPAHNGTIRCTDVYQKDAGKWLIVNEHCSAAPAPAAGSVILRQQSPVPPRGNMIQS